MLLASNRSLAEYNLSQRPALQAAKEQMETKHAAARQLEAEVGPTLVTAGVISCTNKYWQVRSLHTELVGRSGGSRYWSVLYSPCL